MPFRCDILQSSRNKNVSRKHEEAIFDCWEALSTCTMHISIEHTLFRTWASGMIQVFMYCSLRHFFWESGCDQPQGHFSHEIIIIYECKMFPIEMDFGRPSPRRPCLFVICCLCIAQPNIWRTENKIRLRRTGESRARMRCRKF